jgi:hypothetical protein
MKKLSLGLALVSILACGGSDGGGGAPGKDTSVTPPGPDTVQPRPGLDTSQPIPGQDTVQPPGPDTVLPGPDTVQPPGPDTVQPGPDTVQPPLSGVVINEILYDTDMTDKGCFLELKGPPGAALDGYVLVGINAKNGDEYAKIDLSGKVIPADGYFVLAQDDTVAAADAVDPLADLQNGPDSVVLRKDGAPADAVGYGDFGATDVYAGEGSPAPGAGQNSGLSIGRLPDGKDTNDNKSDWAILGGLSPGLPNQ